MVLAMPLQPQEALWLRLQQTPAITKRCIAQRARDRCSCIAMPAAGPSAKAAQSGRHAAQLQGQRGSHLTDWLWVMMYGQMLAMAAAAT
jgi:hypothetical protein